MIYMISIMILLLIFVWFMPKRISLRDMVVIWITASYVEIVVDLYLDKVMKLYHFGASDELSVFALTTKLVSAPLFAIPFINFMPREFKRFIPYWIAWVVFSTFFEWTTTKFGYLTYTGWELWYSFIFYLFMLPLFRWFFLFIESNKS